MDKHQIKYSNIKDQDPADVWDASINSFGPLFSRSNSHGSLENQNIGAKDYKTVH